MLDCCTHPVGCQCDCHKGKCLDCTELVTTCCGAAAEERDIGLDLMIWTCGDCGRHIDEQTGLIPERLYQPEE